MLQDVEAAGRLATTDEHTVLARWSGWGALPGVFDEGDERWADIRQELRRLLDDEGWAEAERSTINAHYTDPNVVMAMWDAVRDLGFETGRVLEPGCGSGNFIAYAPDGASMVGVERDRTTAAIARALYPDAEIHIGRFEKFDVHTPFDAAVGNVPFAKVAPVDPRYNRARLTIHNYFLSKSLQLVRPGGLVLGLTSRYTLDARNPAARRELAQHGDLLGAMRLPSGAMRAIAGTDAILDLLVLSRRAPGSDPAGATGWDLTVEVDLLDENTESTGQIRTNRYFADHPERVLGTPVLGRAMYHAGDLIVRSDLDGLSTNVRSGLAEIIAATQVRYEPAAPIVPGRLTPAPRKVGDTDIRGDRFVPLRHGSFVVSRTGIIYQHQHGELVSAGVGRGASAEVRALVELRDSTVNLLRLESDDAPDQEIEATRQRLAGGYERYRRRWGPLNRVSWQRTGRTGQAAGDERQRRVPARLGGFRHDPEWPTLAAIEVYDEETNVATPAAIQQHRTIHPPAPRLGAETAEEALAVCLDEHGRVDLDRISELLGVETDAAEAEIAPLVYEDPDSSELIPTEDYLSGDVRLKLAAAQASTATDGRFQRNVDALVGVQPPQISPGDIVARPGVPWIEPTDVAAFADDILGIESPRVNYMPALGSWSVEGHAPPGRGGEWSTMRMTSGRLLDATLNQRMVRIYDTVDKRQVLNVAETTAAREKQEIIAERFARWVWEDPERADRLADRYNELFNSYVPPNYTGEHLTLPGLATTFVPHGHQRAAVARILREGRALLGHAVGAGKTATMVIAGMELRRLGLTNRPAYVVPNHMLEQFSREFLQLYPQARVLITSRNLTGPAGRKEFVARASTGDWDAVVITHSAFERLPLQEATFKSYMDHHTAELRVALAEAERLAQRTQGGRDGDGKKRTVKQMELALERREAELERLLGLASKDDGVCFEETGIDRLFVDELHVFKNKSIVTAVEGVGRRQGSRRATDLDAKVWYLHDTHGARALVGATATPIANSIAEAWTMQTYLQPDVLAEAGLDTFDAWAATFAQQVNAVELAPDGASYRVATRLARYQNVPELIGQFRRTADVRVRDDLDLTLPRLKGAAPEVVVVPASPGLDSYVASLVRRAEAVRNRAVEPKDDNLLKITSDGRHAALDLRLVDQEPDPTGGKLAVAAERIATIYNQTRDLEYVDPAGNPSPTKGGFQFVFCDLSTPKGDGSWNAYGELKHRLVTAGIPGDEVAFIHDAGNDEQRAQLFAKCRQGQVAVLIGSTEKMGVGSNIHTRAVALHHIDCPWRPADIEQREGRVIRQGNQNTEVQILRYATEGSFDVYMWQTVERKGTFISQLMRGDHVGRDIDDVGDAVLSYAEVKALASGNPLVIEQAGVQADLAKYERLEHAHRDQEHQLQRDSNRLRRNATTERQRAEALEQALERRTDTSGDRFEITVDGERLTRRPDAAKRLNHRLRTVLHDLADQTGGHVTIEDRAIAKVGGFDVSLRGHRLNTYKELVVTLHLGETADKEIRVRPDDLANEKFNVVARLENPIRRLDDDIERTRQRSVELDEEAAGVEARLSQPFQHQERLTKLRTRNREILDQLDAEAKETQQATANPPQRPGAPDPISRIEDLKRRPQPPRPESPGL